MICDEFYKLNNGVRIPKVGLGTWQTSNNEAQFSVNEALNLGYRHIDTAVAYDNETGVGLGLQQALKSTGIHRESIFITSKIPAEIKDYKTAVQCIEESYNRLKADHIDMMLIHAPKPWSDMGNPNAPTYYQENLHVWRAMEEAYEWGKFRSIGVSNFSIDDLKNILDHGRVKPVVNQVKVHIGCIPHSLISFCQENGILVEAYSPNATGRLKNVAEIVSMAKKYGVSVPQLASRFCLQLGLLPLPKSVHSQHIQENIQLDFSIENSDMNTLLAITL